MRIVKRIISSQQFKNGIWMYILQFFQMIIPLMIFPYITRVLGASAYGDFSVALVVITYIQIVVEYGFNFSGTRKLALSDKSDLNNIYSRIFSAKILLTMVSFAILMGIVLVAQYTKKQKICLICLSGIILGSLLQQTWVFQGLQKMKFITITNVIARIISVVLIFLCVKNSTDVYLYCILYSSTNFLSGIISVGICKKKFNLRIKPVKILEILIELKDGFSLFLTSAMARVVASIGVLFLGIYESNYNVGVFTAIQKIPNIIVMCYTPISQVLFPYMSKLFEDDKTQARKMSRCLFIPLIIVTIIISIGVCVFANQIVTLLCGVEYLDGLKYIPILSAWIVASIINNILGSLILVANGKNNAYGICFGISVLIAIPLNYFLAIYYGCLGVAYATLLTELILLVSMSLVIIRNYNNLFFVNNNSNKL